MLLRTTADRETRILTRVGLALLIGAVALGAAVAAYRPLARDAAGHTALIVDTPYVGPGVKPGTPVIMFGARVGEVAALGARPGGGVRLRLHLQPDSTAGLTDRVELDFRPANYFGITGVNLVPGPPGGAPLHDGMRLSVLPRGNHTMQSLLDRLSEITDGVVTPQLVSVLDRAGGYVDGLAPLAETMLQVANTVAAVQTVAAGRLVRNLAGVTVAAPVFVDGATDLADRLAHTPLTDPATTEEFFADRFLATVDLASTGLFGTVGRLASSHVEDLLPLTEVIRTLTAPIPSIARAPDIAATLPELRTRFQRMYEGSGEQRALRVRLVLDALPATAAPLGLAAESA